MNEELRPCPFCGGIFTIVKLDAGVYTYEHKNSHCVMFRDSRSFPIWFAPKLIVEALNYRKAEDALKSTNITASQIIVDLQNESDALKVENERYRTALAEYADDSRWFYAGSNDEWFWSDPKGLRNGGPMAAREAMALRLKAKP